MASDFPVSQRAVPVDVGHVHASPARIKVAGAEAGRDGERPHVDRRCATAKAGIATEREESPRRIPRIPENAGTFRRSGAKMPGRCAFVRCRFTLASAKDSVLRQSERGDQLAKTPENPGFRNDLANCEKERDFALDRIRRSPYMPLHRTGTLLLRERGFGLVATMDGRRVPR